jgi:hypothetical protein
MVAFWAPIDSVQKRFRVIRFPGLKQLARTTTLRSDISASRSGKLAAKLAWKIVRSHTAHAAGIRNLLEAH